MKSSRIVIDYLRKKKIDDCNGIVMQMLKQIEKEKKNTDQVYRMGEYRHVPMTPYRTSDALSKFSGGSV